MHFHELTFHDEGDTVTVGRADEAVYVSLPPDGAALLTELVSGRSPERAADWYREQYGVDVDITDFLESLDELGFLVTADEPVTDRGAVGFQRLGRILFSAPALVGYALLVLGGVAAVVVTPSTRPTPGHLIVGTSVSLNLLLLIMGQLPFVALHEAAHTLAGRRLGLRSRTTLSHRFLDVVVETRLDGLVGIPRRQRVLPIMAGIGTDLVVWSVLTIASSVAVAAEHPAAASVLLALAFATLMRVVWQLFFCMRTDIYYLVSLTARTEDLHATSRWLIGTWFRRLIGSTKTSRFTAAHWPPRDLRHARWYAPFMIVGYLGLVLNLLLVLGPVTVHLWRSALTPLVSGDGSAAHTADSLIFLLLNLTQIAIALLIKRHEARTGR